MELKKVKKPWGYYINIYKSKNVNIKIIKVEPDSCLSLQFHEKRRENWILSEGTGICQIGDKIIKMKPEKIYEIPKKKKHRLFGGKKGCEVVEVSFGSFLESDIIRIEDIYGRIKNKK